MNWLLIIFLVGMHGQQTITIERVKSKASCERISKEIKKTMEPYAGGVMCVEDKP